MKLQSMLPFRTAMVGLLMLDMAVAQNPSGITQQYCSNQNTGSNFSPVYSIYQSMGSCSKTCRDQYAFAVVQGKNCWCSDYIPAEQSSVYDCSSDCPGYPGDWCGNPEQGMFGYIALNKQPSGTAGASSQQPESTPAQPQSSSPPTSSASPTPTSSPEPETSVVSILSTVTSVKTKEPEPDTVTAYVTPTPPSSSAPAPSSSDPPSSSSAPTSISPTHSPTPVIHTKVITRSGSVVTQTVTTTPVVISGGNSEGQLQMKRRSGLSGGAIAGIVIGALAGLVFLAFGAFFLYRRRKSTDAEANSAAPKRSLSKKLLLGGGRPASMAENHYEPDPYAAGGASVRNSMLFGAGAAVEPSSPLSGSQGDLTSTPDRRSSRPMVYDQRLNPSALFANAEANGSRVSMQDQQDYSRPLGVTNPDLRGSFDSRVSR